MDGRLSSAPSSSGTAAAAAVSFPEENAIVLDKWLMDVCGEEDLQFPSHRRALYPAYVERLRRVSKSRQFMANTFDYPSRSGTREVLVLQKTLEALTVEEQLVRREINGVQENVTQVRRVLDERTMGAASLVEEEKVQAAKLAEMRAEQAATKTAAAAAGTTAATTAGPSLPSQAAAAAHPRGYAQLGGGVPVAVVTAPPRPTPAKSDAPLPMTVSYDDDDDDHSTANSSVSTRSANTTNNNNTSTSSRASGQSVNTFSAIARAARRADYDKKRALAQRYLVEVQRQSQSASERRAEVQTRHTTLCAQKKQLDQEYEALQTTEALVVARHEEAAAHNHEETALLAGEAAAYAAEDAAFAAVWEDVEAEAEAEASARVGDAGPPNAGNQTAAYHDDPAAEPTDDTSPLPDRQAQQEGHDALADSTVGSASRTPAEHDVSPPEAHLTTDRPATLGSNSVASSTADAASHTSSPVERVLRLGANDDEEEERGEDAAAPARPSSAVVAAAAAVVAAHNKERRRADLEELRHRLSALGAATQACRRQLLNTAQTHMGRFRQAQQRLKDWQDISAGLRATYHQRQGQVAVLHTALQDAAARLDADSADSTYAQQLFKLNEVLKERSYETLQYYMGSGDAAATEMLYDANAEEELRALHRPSPSAAAGGMTPVRGAAGAGSGSSPYSTASSAAPTREGSPSSAYHSNFSAAVASAPHKHRSRYEVVRHLQRWEAALLVDRLAILKAACMTPGPFNGAGANTKKAEGFNATRCYQELRHLLLQAKQSNGTAAA